MTLGNGYSFTLTAGNGGYRLTHPLQSNSTSATKPSIWIFGCSFTHGWAVNDDETYPWHLQEALPQYEVRNFGVEGYSTLASLLQFKLELAKTPHPHAVLLAYGGFHNMRNTFTRARRRQVAAWHKLGPHFIQPYARLDSAGKLQIYMEETIYKPIPLAQTFALPHFFEDNYILWEERNSKSVEVTQLLVEEFAALAKSKNIPFFVGGLKNSETTEYSLKLMKNRGIPTIDMALNFDERGLRHPFDSHPSPLAHKKYAEKILSALQKEKLVDF